MSVDISNIAEENYRYAIHLATFQSVLTYKNGFYEMAKTPPSLEPFEVVDFWRNVSLCGEVLLKACLLKHRVPFFKKRANYEYGERVTALSNEWLHKTLNLLEIKYVAEINTGSVSTALRSAQNELFNKIAFDAQKVKLITEIFYIIIRTRRNRNSHFFFPNQNSIDVGEIEILFLPLLNLLEELYRV